LTVSGNVALPLRNKAIARQARERLTTEALQAVGLGGSERQYPWQLSGGMQQRVAIARALAYQPEILLMDEPFASVDAQTRSDLEDLVLNVRRKFDITVVFVTHDIDESVYLGDRVIVLTQRPGRVRDVIRIDLPFPRDQVVTKQSPEFGRLRTRILQEIRGVMVDCDTTGNSPHREGSLPRKEGT
jgi:NitT/TauT family transport system ATP-binding protein